MSESVQLFNDNSQAIALRRDESAVARATQEIQAALVIAQRNPRDEIKASNRILEACKRPGLAEVAEYEYRRGGTTITGPTIDLLRAIASRWGNLLFGWEEKERRDGESSLRAWAWDTQSNSRAERTWIVRHWRDTREGGRALDDERDIYELLANSAARRLRACLEEVIDSDIVQAAVDQCRNTLRLGEKAEGPLIDQVRKAVSSFLKFDVTQEEIERWAGRKADTISHIQLASLRRIFKALSDGVGKKDDYFKPEAKKPEFADSAKSQSANPPSEPASTPAPAKSSEPAVRDPATDLPDANRLLKAVSGLMKMAGIGERQVLDFLAKDGVTDGSVGSLQELYLRFPDSVQLMHDRWGEFAQKVKEAR